MQDPRLANLMAAPDLGRVYVPLYGPSPERDARGGLVCSCPRGPACPSPAKHPVLGKWYEALGTREEARRWIGAGRNVGIATGPATGIMVVDLDDETAVSHWGELAGDLETLEVQTSKGRHVYLTIPAGVEIRNSVRGDFPGYAIDVRGLNGLAVGPGSVHISGRIYKPDGFVDGLALAPGWLVERLAKRSEEPRARLEPGGTVAEGGRNNMLISLAGTLRSRGLDDEALATMVRELNRTVCKPPLEELEVEALIRNACKFAPGEPVRLINLTRGLRLEVEPVAPPVGVQAVDEPAGDPGDGLEVAAVTFGGDGKPTAAGVARAVASTVWADNPVIYHRGTWYRYDGRRYQETPDATIRLDVARVLQGSQDLEKKSTRGFIGDTVENLAAMVQVADALELPCWAPGVAGPRRALVASNGIVDLDAYLEEREPWLLPHNPDFLATVALPYAVDPAAWSGLWEDTLDAILPPATAAATRRELQKWTGLQLIPDTSYQRAAILVGEGANGKSTVLEVIARLLGAGAYSTVSLEAFGERFELAQMVGKLANLAHEMGEIDKLAEGILKQLISAEPMTFERKFRDPFRARPTARLTFATNGLPRFADRSQGIWRRLMVFPMTETIPVERQDRALLDKLERELPGIFNWAIEGLAMLLRDGFIEGDAMATAKLDHRQAVNPVLLWLEEATEAANWSEVELGKLHEAYAGWVRQAGNQPLSRSNFERELERQGYRVVRPRLPNGTRPRIVKGLKAL